VVVAIVEEVEPCSSDSPWSSDSSADSTHAVVEVDGATVVVVVVVSATVVVVGSSDSTVVSSTVDLSAMVVVEPAIVVVVVVVSSDWCTTAGFPPAGPLIALATVTPPSNAPAAARATKERGNRPAGFQPWGVLSVVIARRSDGAKDNYKCR
jgi:hypothetical protein